MDIKRIIGVLFRRIWVIALTLVATMAVVILGTHLQTPIYQSSTTLRIATSAGSQLSYQDYQYADRLMNTYIKITTSEPVLAELGKRLNLSKPLSADNVKVEILPSTELIKITVQNTNPKMAATEANTLAEILITQSSQLYTGGGMRSSEALGKQLAIIKDGLGVLQQNFQQLLVQTPPAPEEIAVAQQTLNLQQNSYATLLSQYEQASIRETMQANMVTIVEPATAPLSPSKPNPILNYVLGLVLGWIGGVGLAFLLENLDTTIHIMDDIESIPKPYIRLSTLAKIPKANRKQMDISKNGISSFAEAFRNLATKIQLISHQQPSKVLLIISAEPRQGKSMIVSNLVFALAEAGKKVVAVDCDMRLPKLHRLFRLSNQYGLSDILEGKADLTKSLQKSQYKGVNVITSGSLPDNPSQLLSSPKMAELVNKLSQEFDYVLLDAPALLSVIDTEILIHDANGLIIVERLGYAKRESVQMVSKFLAGFQEKLIGLVINEADNISDYGYYQSPRKPDRPLARENQSLLDRFVHRERL
jgi:succinoglycan biosynthesis transport protein ExoP